MSTLLRTPEKRKRESVNPSPPPSALISDSEKVYDFVIFSIATPSTTHYSVSAEVRAEMGVTEGMLRLNVGLEDPLDVIDDLDQALRTVGL